MMYTNWGRANETYSNGHKRAKKYQEYTNGDYYSVRYLNFDFYCWDFKQVESVHEPNTEHFYYSHLCVCLLSTKLMLVASRFGLVYP